MKSSHENWLVGTGFTGLIVLAIILGLFLTIPGLAFGKADANLTLSHQVHSVSFGQTALQSKSSAVQDILSITPNPIPNPLLRTRDIIPPALNQVKNQVKPQIKSLSLSVPSSSQIPSEKAPSFDLDAMIGRFPYPNEKPAPFPHWKLSAERRSIELYAPREFISSQVFSLARFAGDIDRQSKKEEVAKKGFIKGFVYPPHQVLAWLNNELNKEHGTFDRLDNDEHRLVQEFIDLGVVSQTTDGFVWNKKYEDWPINAYSSAGVFRHERVHVLWFTYSHFGEYFKSQWDSDTQGMTKQQKIGFVLNHFEEVPYNRPPSYAWWDAVFNQVGEEDVINEFTAHSIEKLPDWRHKVLPIAM